MTGTWRLGLGLTTMQGFQHVDVDVANLLQVLGMAVARQVPEFIEPLPRTSMHEGCNQQPCRLISTSIRP